MRKTKCLLFLAMIIFLLPIWNIGCKHHHSHVRPVLRITRPGPNFLGTTGRIQNFEAQLINSNAKVTWEINGVVYGTGFSVSFALPDGSYDVVAKVAGIEDKIHVIANALPKYLITAGELNRDVYLVDEAFNSYNITRSDTFSYTGVDISANGDLITFSSSHDTIYESKIYLAKLDGSDRQELASFAKNPRFSADGSAVFYLSSVVGEIRQVNINTKENIQIASSVECFGNTNICWSNLTEPVPDKALPSSLFFSGREVNFTSSQRVVLKLDIPSSSASTTNQPGTYDFTPLDFFSDRQVLTAAVPRNSGSYSQVVILDTTNGALTNVSPVGDSNNQYIAGAFSSDGLRVAYVNRRNYGNDEVRIRTLSTSAEKTLSFGNLKRIDQVRFVP